MGLLAPRAALFGPERNPAVVAASRAPQSASAPWDESASFCERIFWLSLFTCPTCRKIYRPVVLWQSHCSVECSRLDPRQHVAAIAESVPQYDPLAPPALPWE